MTRTLAAWYRVHDVLGIARVLSRRPLLALVGLAAVGCCDVRSIEPAIDSAHAIAIPEIVGTWRSPDSTLLIVERDTGFAPGYVVRVRGLADRSRRDPDGGPPSVWLRGRIGRLGGRLVAEVTPASDQDDGLRVITRDYSLFLTPMYVVVGLDVGGDSLRYRSLNLPSLSERAPALLKRPNCQTPYHFVNNFALVFTGSSAEARAAYACIIEVWGFESSETVFHRDR